MRYVQFKIIKKQAIGTFYLTSTYPHGGIKWAVFERSNNVLIGQRSTLVYIVHPHLNIIYIIHNGWVFNISFIW